MATKQDFDLPHSASTKKSRILSLYSTGITDVSELAHLSGAKPSYVASILQQSGLLAGYYDLYTHTSSPMNAYSKYFAGKLGFRNEDIAKRSVEVIDRLYRAFEGTRDRAGQHHALVVALTLCDRARWSGKMREAALFRNWLVQRLQEEVKENALGS